MESSHILATIIILGVIVFWLIKTNKLPKPEKLSYPARMSFVLILFGIFFGDNRALGYLLIGTGMIFAVWDIIKNQRSEKSKHKAKKGK